MVQTESGRDWVWMKPAPDRPGSPRSPFSPRKPRFGSNVTTAVFWAGVPRTTGGLFSCRSSTRVRLTLIDTESGRTREIDTNNRGLRERYAAAASEQRSDIQLAIAGSGAHHLQLRTDRDWLLDLARHVASTKRRQANVGGAHR